MISGIDEITGQPLALSREPKKTLDSEDFMLLFIKQLQYQDPMNPIENNEMAMQMAMFSQVDQLFKLNEGFQTLLEMAQNFDFSTTASLVGKLVKVAGNTGRVEEGKFLGAEFELEEPANQVEVIISDESGHVVKRLDLGALPEGTHKIDWDATDEDGEIVPNGNYLLKVVFPEQDFQDPVSITVYGRVTGAVLGEENQLIINGRESIGLKELKEILYPNSV